MFKYIITMRFHIISLKLQWKIINCLTYSIILLNQYTLFCDLSKLRLNTKSLNLIFYVLMYIEDTSSLTLQMTPRRQNRWHFRTLFILQRLFNFIITTQTKLGSVTYTCEQLLTFL